MVRLEIWSNKVQIILRNVSSTLYRDVFFQCSLRKHDHKSLRLPKVRGIAFIYYVSFGISAHITDNIGSKWAKPWGELIVKTISGGYYNLFAIFPSPGDLLIIDIRAFLILIGIVEVFYLHTILKYSRDYFTRTFGF